MEDHEIQALLAAAPQAGMIQRPPNTVAILRSSIAEEHHAHADAWVVANGGAIRRTKPVPSQSQRAGRRRPQTLPPETYYLLPRAALKP
jgi:hypothetical protein